MVRDCELAGGLGFCGFNLSDRVEDFGLIDIAHAAGHRFAVLSGLGSVNFFGEVANGLLQLALAVLGGLDIVAKLEIALDLEANQNHQMQRPQREN